jgi:hypothetical protein
VLEFVEARSEAKEQEARISWEQTRWLGAIILQPHMKKGKTIKPSDLIALPWDKKETKASDEEQERKRKEREELFKKWDADIKKKTYGE